MKFYNLHTHHFTNNHSVVDLVNQYPWEFNENIPNYSIGIHPWYIDEERLPKDIAYIEKKLASENCLAVGECGLDKRIETPLELQKKVFEAQILLAEKYKKPLILHIVAAFDELLEIKKKLKISVPLIIHGFSKNENIANQLINNGFYLSFGKYLLRNPDLKKVFQSVPNDKFFLETDTIEENIEVIYQRASQYKNLKLNELQKQVEYNWKNIL